MAIIKRKLENLKPNREYLLTVRAKNADINVSSDYAKSIRFIVPQDSTIPGSIQNLNLYASFEKVMFVFDFSEDIDIDQYEYELYDGNNVETATLVSSGFNAANVFTVSVTNSSSTPNYTGPTTTFDINALSYWGRVRAIDTTGNIGEWTTLVQTDSETPLIGEQFIDSLTASKITAGKIGAHTIELNGSNSIIKSANYVAGSLGWKIEGDGSAEFSEVEVRGTIDIGGNDNTSFHVDSDGNMWLGAGSLLNAPFRVESDGSVEIGQSTASGQVNTSLFIDTDGSIHIGTSVATSPFSILSSGEVNIGTSPNLFKISTDGSVQIGKTSVSKTINAVASGTPSSGYVRYTTSAAHGFSSGDSVTISGLAPSGYNGSYIITSIVSSTQFAVANTTTATVTDANGTVQTNSLFIDNEGAINIGPSLSSALSEFIVQANGQVDIGGNSSSSFHIDNFGNVWTGANKTSFSSAPFKLNNDGSLDVGGNDATSLHIGSDGDVYSGVSKGSSSSAPFWLEADTGLIHVGEIQGTQRPAGLTTDHIWLSNPMWLEDNRIRGGVGSTYTGTISNVAPSTPSAGSVRYTASSHPFVVGDSVVITGLSPSGYNGTFTITATTANTFTVANSTTSTPTDEDGSVQGSYTMRENWYLSASTGFVGRYGTTALITLDANGLSSPALPVEAGNFKTTNGTAALPAYRFTTATDGFYSDGTNPFWSNSGTGYKMWHAGNDGAGSTLNADTVDGLEGSQFLRSDASDSTSGSLTINGTLFANGGISHGDVLISTSAAAAYWSNSTYGLTLGKFSSAQKYKTDILPIESSNLDYKNILNIPVVQFKYKENVLSENDQRFGLDVPGFIAEDILKHYPIACDLGDNGEVEGWNIPILMAPILKLIQELWKKVEKLEQKM